LQNLLGHFRSTRGNAVQSGKQGAPTPTTSQSTRMLIRQEIIHSQSNPYIESNFDSDLQRPSPEPQHVAETGFDFFATRQCLLTGGNVF
jgi:hypothetical protein